MAMSERLRWKLWMLVTRHPRACPSNAHTAIVSASRDRSRNPFVDRTCRRDFAANGVCYCGKLRNEEMAADD